MPIAPSDPASAGVTDVLHVKARQRRDRHRALTAIGDQTPARRNDFLPQLAISYVPIEQLRLAQRRVRRPDSTQVARVLASIKEFGVCHPVLVDSENRIVHGRARGDKEQNWTISLLA